MDIKKLYHNVNIKILIVEVLFFYVILFIVGYFLNQKYILGIKPISFLLVFLAVITLYYGIIGGLLSLAVSFLPILFFYKNAFPVSLFLWNLLMILIFSEFNVYWNRQIKKNQEENRYYRSKFDELRKNFFFLKLSHEQIEKSYVVKPVSIRNIVQKIKETFILEDGRHYDELIKLISNLFSIEKCSLYLKTGGAFREAVNIGDSINFNSDDPLIKKVLEEKTASYMPVLLVNKGNVSQYLAVIPVVIENDIKAIFLIESIPFVSYSKENMMLIDLFLNYSFEDMELLNSIKYEIKEYINSFDVDFLKEVFKLSKIWEKFKIESIIIAYFIKDKDNEDNFLNFIEGMIRSLDMVCFVKDKGVFLTLLPFTNNAGGKSFSIRLNNSILSRFGKTFLDDKIYQKTYVLKNNFNFIMAEINRND